MKEPVHWCNTAVCTAADQLIETCFFLFFKESGQTGDLNSPILSENCPQPRLAELNVEERITLSNIMLIIFQKRGNASCSPNEWLQLASKSTFVLQCR